jgi:equilibrative nucleoside transporter 1/2/3
MERIRRWIASPAPAAYEPIEEDEDNRMPSQRRQLSQFSRFEYAVFFLLGISMLWAWYVY